MHHLWGSGSVQLGTHQQLDVYEIVGQCQWVACPELQLCFSGSLCFHGRPGASIALDYTYFRRPGGQRQTDFTVSVGSESLIASPAEGARSLEVLGSSRCLQT